MAQRTTNVTCVARLFRLMAQRTTNVTCIARLFRVIAQRTTNVTCVARSFRVMALRTTFISYVARLSCLMALRTRYVSCVARFFASRLRDIFSVSPELTSGESDRLLPGRTVFIGPDRVCLPTSSTPLAAVNLLLPVPLIKRLAPISGCIGHEWVEKALRTCVP